MNENSIEMASFSQANADFSQVDSARRRPPSSKFLRALGLMKITKKTTVTSVPLSKSYDTGTPDKNAGGCHTSATKELIRPLKKHSQSKSVVVIKGHVSNSKDRAKKLSHATSFDEPQSTPVVVIKKAQKGFCVLSRNRNLPATHKPTTKKETPDVKEQQHKASPPATNVSSSALKSTVTSTENLSELTSTADDVRFRSDLLKSDFKSMNFITLLKHYQFTEEQIQVIQKSFQYMYQTFCRMPKLDRYMKIHECTKCHFSLSHECMSIGLLENWTIGVPCIDFITPESTTMCLCNFTIFHSHSPKFKYKREAELPVRSPLPSTSSLVQNFFSVNLACPKCYMNVSITNRNKGVCSDLNNFKSANDPILKKFIKYVYKYLDYATGDSPVLSEFYSCNNLCCVLFHRCAKNVCH